MIRSLLKAIALLLPVALVVYLALGAAFTVTKAMNERLTTQEAKR